MAPVPAILHPFLVPKRRPFLLALPALAFPALARGQALPTVIHPSQAGLDQPLTRRGANGAFAFMATINGAPISMLFDTGATEVVLRQEDAARVGFDIAELRYSAYAMTANGRTAIAPVILDSITVGGITRRNVRAAVARPGLLSNNLLGQSFLVRIAGYRTEGDRLILQGD